MVEQTRDLEDAIEQLRQIRHNIGDRLGFRSRTVLDMLLTELTHELTKRGQSGE